MIMKFKVSMTIVILFVAVAAFAAKEVFIHNGFGTGQDYIKMTSAEKRAYAMGAINGMLLAPMFGASKDKMRWMESYVENMTDEQVVAILSKYLEDNPGRWHDGLHILMYSALKEAHDKSRTIKK
jgi:c-di-AMP phosphodiesterase-like protein